MIDTFRPRRPLVALAIALLSGQLCGGSAHPDILAGSAALIAAGAVMQRRLPLAWLAAALCAYAIGLLQVAALLSPRFTADHVVHGAGMVVDVAGRVQDCVPAADGRLRLTLELDTVTRHGTAQHAAGRVLVTVAHPSQPWQAGDHVQATLPLRRPRNFGNPGEFDYTAFLARRRIYVTAFAMRDTTWTRTERHDDLTVLPDAWRTAIRAAITRSLHGVARDILAALIIGDTGSLPRVVWDRYARTGVAHVLSISGLHISLVATSSFAVVRWLLTRSVWVVLRVSVPKICVIAAAIPVMLYGILAGGSAPTLRSVVMIMVLGLGLVLNRRRDWLTSLAAAALLIALCWPGTVFEVSFQLSFVSVLAITLGMPPIVARWRAWEESRLVHLQPRAWRYRLWRAVVLSVGTSACAAIGTAPLTAYQFNQVSLITLVANLLIVPLLGVVPVGAGLLGALCIVAAPDVASGLFQIGGLCIRAADAMVAVLSDLPAAAVRTVSLTLLELITLYALLGAAVALAGRRRVIALCGCSAILLVDAGYWYRERFDRGQLRITFLSVGQGDCAVIEFPGSRVMVVDGGGMPGSFDVGERVVAPYLWQRKIAHVDTLVLSHADLDHYGGLTFLAREFRPAAFWWNGIAGRAHQWQDLWSALHERGDTAKTIGQGLHADIEGVAVDVLGPTDTAVGSLNDRSLVVRLQYGPTAVLFTGDIEADGEHRLVASAAGDVSATILKVPHHGSRTSSTPALLQAVAPRIAIISAGFDNRFHLPHASVLERYARQHVAVWRTDRDGAIVAAIAADGATKIARTGGGGEPPPVPTEMEGEALRRRRVPTIRDHARSRSARPSTA